MCVCVCVCVCICSIIARTLLAIGANTASDAALEIVRQEGVEERVEAAVDVCQTGARYLDKN